MACAIAPLKSCLILLAASAVLPGGAIAQVISDGTLGAESSQLIDESAVEQLIRGGALRDENLFHSFEQFSIGEGGRVTFDNPAAVQRVFSRVTGDFPSEIFGTLGSTGTADVYFLNPSGIVFGPNARLDVGGSFIASTADAFEFAGLGAYSARASEVPPSLLTILPSALQFGQVLPGEIVVQSAADGLGLLVPNGESLGLLGGAVTVDGGALTAPGGRVAVGAAQTGAVQLAPDEQMLFSAEARQARVTFENGASVDVALGDSGDIQVSASAIEISDSELTAGIADGLGSPGSQAGDIVLSATESVRLSSSNVFNGIVFGATGKGGNIEITTPVAVLDGAQLFADTLGEGDAGSVVITATERVTLAGVDEAGFPSGATSSVEPGGVGKGGNVEITTPVLEMLDGAQLVAGTLGEGDAGSVVINATERVTFAGVDEGGFGSGAFSSVQPDGIGKGGNIEITTPVLEMLDGAQLLASTRGEGDAGSVAINATERVTLAGVDEAGFGGGATSSVEPGGVGKGGNIEITTPVLEVLDGVQLLANTRGEGDAGSVAINATERVTLAGVDEAGFPSDATSSVEPGGVGKGGNVEITTPVLEVLDGAQLLASTSGEGDAGSIVITASERVTFAGVAEAEFLSGAFSSVFEGGIGKGGNIEITTPVLEVVDGAQLLAGTFGEGDAGSVVINATERVTFAGVAFVGENEAGFSSGAFSSVEADGFGKGGNIEITTPVLEVVDGAQLVAGTFGEGDAGSVVINATERLTFAGVDEAGFGSGAFSSVQPDGIGKGNNIEITTPVLEMLDGAQLVASTSGEGDAGSVVIDSSRYVSLDQSSILTDSEVTTGRGGDITIRSPLLTLANQSAITTQTVSTDGGNIAFNLDNLLVLTDNSLISTEAGTEGDGGDGGDITINTQFIATRLSENSDIVADAFDGSGGSVNITATGGIFGIAPRPERTPLSDITASSRNGVSGSIAIESPDVDPNQSSTELPIALDAPDVVQSCREAYVQSGSEFVVTGRGGLPQGPLDSATSLLWQDALPIEGSVQTAPEVESEPVTDSSQATAPPIVEIQGWIKNEQGQIELVAENPQRVAVGQPVVCQG